MSTPNEAIVEEPSQPNIADALFEASDDFELESTMVIFESLYLANGNCKRLLLSMCYGIKDSDRMLGVTTTQPYQSTKRKANFIPNRDFLLAEIKRRSESPVSTSHG
jgi:hypothetical protein